MNNFLKSKRLYMLFVLPFFVAAAAFIHSFFPRDTGGPADVEGVIPLAGICPGNPLGLAVIGWVAVTGLAYLIFGISERYKLLSQTTTLPSLIYVLLVSGLMFRVGFSHLLVVAFIVALAVGRLQGAIRDIQANGRVFDFGCLLVLAVALHPKFVLLAVWGIWVLLFSGRSTLKDMVALGLGGLAPVLFIVFCYFWTDRLDQLPAVFLDSLRQGESIRHLPFREWVRLGILLFLLLTAFYQLSAKYAAWMVNQRRGMLALVSLLIFLVLTFFIFPGNGYDLMYMVALPLSWLYAHFFLTSRKVVFGNLMFVLLLFACLLGYPL